MARGDRHPPDIPLLPAPLIGRRTELASADVLLNGGARLLTLTGPPGVGKTSLALALGAAWHERFADGATFIDLAAVTDADRVAGTIAEILGAGGRRRPLDRVIAMLRRRELLLLLDNFEQVVAAGPVLAELLAACPGLTLVVTSRVPLRLRWEHELPVSPLRLPDSSEPPTAESVADVPAITLFVERAQAVDPGFAVTDLNAPTLAGICVWLDGLPLAIELAAARTRIMAPEVLLGQLAGADGGQTGSLRLLTDGPHDLPARQQTLRDAVAWSYALLEDAERRLLRRLAVFAGGCTYEAAEVVCEATWESISALVEHSLLRQVRLAAGPSRLRMLEVIREFALEQLLRSEEADELYRRHTAYVVELAERAQPALLGPDEARWLERLDRDRDNLQAVERRAVRLGDAETVLRLGAALLRYRTFRDDAAEARARVDEIVGLVRRLPPQPASVRALHAAGVLARFLGEYATSRSLLEESLTMSQQIDHGPGVVSSLRDLARLAYFQDRYADARLLAEESLGSARDLGDQQAIADALETLGFISFLEGDTASARASYEPALAIYRTLGDRRGIGNLANQIGLCFQVEGALDVALPLYEECLAIDRALGHRRSIAMTLQNLANLLCLRGDVARARTLFVESLTAAQETGDRRRLAFTLSAVAGLVAVVGDAWRAVRLDAAAKYALLILGATLAPPVRAGYDRQLGPARQVLGESGVVAAEMAGRTVSLDEAVGEALMWLTSLQVPPDAASPARSAPTEERSLTRRELDVARLVAAGLTNRQIAAELIIADGTASNYVQRVMNRVGLHSRAQIAAWVVARGLLAPAPSTDV